MSETFGGYYYKHQKGGKTVALIPGFAGSRRFLQIITDDASYEAPLTPGSCFTPQGIRVHVRQPELRVDGAVRYTGLTPLRSDIMGPFRFFSMECRHKVVSLYHRTDGSITINGERFDLTGGIGYIEGDSGTSFPRAYGWAQSNDFPIPLSVMASAAEIPFAGVRFRGCIAAVWMAGREYRLATYRGAHVLACDERRLILRQGADLLRIDVDAGQGHPLAAPQNGKMSRTIHEHPSCPARFRFVHDGQLLFDLWSEQASFECVGRLTK